MVHGEGSGAIKGSVWIAEAGLCDMKTGFAERTYRGCGKEQTGRLAMEAKK